MKNNATTLNIKSFITAVFFALVFSVLSLFPALDGAAEQETDGKKCSECNTVLTEQKEIDKLPHSPSDWITDKTPTENEDGQKHKECVNCKEILQVEPVKYEKPADKNEGALPPTEGISPPAEGDNSSDDVPPSNGDEKYINCSGNFNSSQTVLLLSFAAFTLIIAKKRRLLCVNGKNRKKANGERK